MNLTFEVDGAARLKGEIYTGVYGHYVAGMNDVSLYEAIYDRAPVWVLSVSITVRLEPAV